jgi:DNA modification methylase
MSDLKIRCLDEAHGERWSLYNADCVDLARQIPDRSIDMAVYSPPFANLYTYSDSMLDMGNCDDDREFLEHYRFLVDELHRIMVPGRLVAVHCKDLVNYKGRDGMAGLRDFPGDLIRVHQAAGFALHSRVTIWKCPVTEMQRTKAHGLLYKTLRADSTFSRVRARRVPARVPEVGARGRGELRQAGATQGEDFTLDQWQQWASPVWMDVDQTNVLNVEAAREDGDEKHMCPLQLDVIERAVGLWSNPGDIVFSPFAGIGSEGHGSLLLGRSFLGVELKPSYFQSAIPYLKAAERGELQQDLFVGPAKAAP